MIKKIKSISLRLWISFQQSWARADEIHRKIEEQKIENQLKYGNEAYRKYLSGKEKY